MAIKCQYPYLLRVIAKRRESQDDYDWYWDNTTPFEAVFQISADNLKLRLPLASVFNYDFQVDWGDNTARTAFTFENYNVDTSPEASHFYSTPGIYTVKIVKSMPKWRFGVPCYTAHREQILSIVTAGEVGFLEQSVEMEYVFHDCFNLVSIPMFNVSNITSFTGTFGGCTSLEVGAMYGVSKHISYLDCPLSNLEERIKIYNNLEDLVGMTSQIIVMPPWIEQEQFYRHIATDKNWNLTQATPDLPFEFTIEVPSNNYEVPLPLAQKDGISQNSYIYNFVVNWGDGSPTGTVTSYNAAASKHRYGVAGIYTVSITGTMQMWKTLPFASFRTVLRSVDKVGSVGFGTGVKDFSQMFFQCLDLYSLALFDTSSGENFMFMTAYNSILENIPVFDTRNGTNFHGIFSNNLLLKEIPKINTSNAITLSYFCNNCPLLTKFPELDMSNATGLQGVISYNKDLESIPLLNVSSGTDLTAFFMRCEGLKVGALYGTKVDVNYEDCTLLSKEERERIYQNLAIVGTSGSSTKKITMPTSVGEDDSIATNKGWEVQR